MIIYMCSRCRCDDGDDGDNGDSDDEEKEKAYDGGDMAMLVMMMG